MNRVSQICGVLVVIGALIAPAAAQAKMAPAKASPFLGIPVSGTSRDGNTFVGTMDIGGFITDTDASGNPIVEAVGALTGTITQPNGVTSQVTNVVVVLPVLTTPPSLRAPAAAAACTILHLVLGPLDLNLLGLTVHLNQVVLDISAQPGAGNLLGNLLCAIVNLLNGINLGGLTLTQLVNALAALLNQLLGAL